MPPFREVVFVTTRPRRLGHLRKLLRAVRVTSHVRVMDPRQWCDTPEARRERLVFLDAASAPPREALIAARSGAFGSRLVLCCRRPAPEVAQTAIECGLDGVLSANLAPEDAARALQQICRGERQFRFEAPLFRRAPAASSTPDGTSFLASPAERRPAICFSSERIIPTAALERCATRSVSGAPRNVPAVSFVAERVALTAPASPTAPAIVPPAGPRFDTTTPAPRTRRSTAPSAQPRFDDTAPAPRTAPARSPAVRPHLTTVPAPRTAPRAPSAAGPDFDTLWMFGASEV